MNAIRKAAFSLIFTCGFVLHLLGQGTIEFNNFVPGVINAPIFDVDGQTPIGPEWTGQLYGGTTRISLQPLFPITTFQTGFVEPVTVTFPGLEPGEEAFVVMRVFRGDSFEEASRLGMSGESNVLPITLGGGDLPPARLIGLESFTVPEPSSFALVLFLAGVCFLRSRGFRRRPQG